MTSPLAATAAATAAADIHYRVQALDVDAHLFSAQLHIARPAAGQTLSLPVWIPGSYLVREFSKNLQDLSAEQDGRPVALAQQGKNLWQADCAAGVPLVKSWIAMPSPSSPSAGASALRASAAVTKSARL